jgi:hypothetical protein
MKAKQYKNTYECYDCGIDIVIPPSFEGNPYNLIRKHYLDAHGIVLDEYRKLLKSKKWAKSGKMLGEGVGGSPLDSVKEETAP